MITDIRVGDSLVMKKSHPCSSDCFSVLRTGMDVRLRCESCVREIILTCAKAEKMIKTIIRKEIN